MKTLNLRLTFDDGSSCVITPEHYDRDLIPDPHKIKVLEIPKAQLNTSAFKMMDGVYGD